MKTLAALVLAIATMTAYGQQYITGAGSLPGYGLATVTATDTGNASGSAATTVSMDGNFSMRLIRNDTYNFGVTAGSDTQHPAFTATAVKLEPANLSTTAFDLTQIFAKASQAALSGGAGQQTTSLCPWHDSRNICITDPPYNASPDGQTTTATSGTVAPGATVPVVSASTFTAGNGLRIGGAGPGGAAYYGTITQVSSNTITVSPQTSTSIASGTTIWHDETAAFQAAVTALATTDGTIRAPCGFYRISGPLQDTSGANAVLAWPSYPSNGPTYVHIGIEGCAEPNWVNIYNGTTLHTDVTAGSFIGGYNPSTAGTAPLFTNAQITLKNLLIETPDNANIQAVNAYSMLSADLANLLIRPVSCCAVNSGTNSIGVTMPRILNTVQNRMDNITIGGYHTDAVLGEHTRADRLYLETAADCLVADTGSTISGILTNTNGTYTGSSISIGYLWEISCGHGISGGSHPTTIHVDNFDSEVATVDVYDPGSMLHLSGGFLNPYNSGTCALNMSGGAAHVKMSPLFCPNAGAPPLAEWTMNEGSGLTLNDSGTNGDTATAASGAITWQSNTGLPGTTAYWTGTGSATANASLTNFDGTTPFSVGMWVNPASLTAEQTFVSTLDPASNYKGWEVQINQFGAVNFILVSTYPSNALQVIDSNALTSGPHYVVVTYDGSRTAAGVKIYVDGALRTNNPSGQIDTLSASAASGLSLHFGSRTDGSNEYTGAMAFAEIWTYAVSPANITANYTAGPGLY